MTKYEVIKKDILQKIENQEWKSNQVIPSESDLCDLYNVSRITVRRALDELVKDRVLYRIKGKGCFVCQIAKDGLSNIHSFTEVIKHRGMVPSKKQISFEVVEADEELAEKLEIKPGESVYVLKCLYMANGEPYCVNISKLPVNMFNKLEFFDFNDKSLYEILKTFYNISFTRVHQTIVATNADEEINELLENKEKKPMLQIDGISRALFDNVENVCEYYTSYILTDILSYQIEKYNK